MEVTDSSRLRTFQHYIEDMRNLTLCKICLKPFYEPFILACGHTYCYGCLSNWFGRTSGRRRTRNCPDCRADVTTQPAPNYLLRDLVHMFINREELLPEDETIEEHNCNKYSEAGQLVRDRAGAGLFGGVFKRGMHFRPRPIIDQEDHVSRCPVCGWELEGGECSQCDWADYEGQIRFSDEEFSDEDSIPVHRQFYGIGSDEDDIDEDGEDSDYHSVEGRARVYTADLDQYDEHDDFIDDEDDLADPDQWTDYESDYRTFEDARDASTRDIIQTALEQVRRSAGISAPARATTRPSERIVTRPSARTVTRPSARTAPSPPENSDSDDSSSVDIRPWRSSGRRRARVVIGDDEDEDEDSGAETTTNPTDNTSVTDGTSAAIDPESDSHMNSEADSDESEDTVLPAQSRSRRQQRLNSHRNRRSNNSSPSDQSQASEQASHSHQRRGYGRIPPARRQALRRRQPVTSVY